MKTLVALMTVSGMLVTPQITKASLTWVDTPVAASTKDTPRLNEALSAMVCTIPMKLLSKHEILIEDKFSIQKVQVMPEC